MALDNYTSVLARFERLELLAHQIVEGFLSGKHKSPFHGFSAEFAEHKVYNSGESTRYIDWKLFARTDRLYTKSYEDETNLRCHFIVDNSSSMHYPGLSDKDPFYESKIGFSVLAVAVLMNLLKKQRDALGLSVFSDSYEQYFSEKGSDRHHRTILHTLEGLLVNENPRKGTETVRFLHQIAENIHRRSLVILFTDMFQQEEEEKLFTALQHLTYNKHRVVLFHTYHRATEMDFGFEGSPRKFIDLETGESINLFADQAKDLYTNRLESYFAHIKQSCMRYHIRYIPVAVEDQFDQVIYHFLTERQLFKK